MPFFFKGKQKSFLEGEPYYALYRSGFAKEHGITREASDRRNL